VAELAKTSVPEHADGWLDKRSYLQIHTAASEKTGILKLMAQMSANLLDGMIGVEVEQP